MNTEKFNLIFGAVKWVLKFLKDWFKGSGTGV
jgi:hypothetical protein